MSASVLAVLTLALTSTPRLLHDSLAVVTDDRELGEEIARAARRYMRGTVQTRAVQQAPTPEPGAALRVRQEAALSTGQRWTLTLSSGPARVIRRTLDLHEVPSRFDLAEAVAIGLPDMLARLDEQVTVASAPTSPRPAAAAPVIQTARPVVAMVSRTISTARTLPLPAVASPARKTETSIQPEPAAPSNSNTPLKEAVAEPPTPAPPSTVPIEKKLEPAKVYTVYTSKSPANPGPIEAPPTPLPSAAVGLVAGGAVVLLAGLGTGAAAMLTARQVDTPMQMRFDPDLDRRGKALDTAAIVLDCVGAAALAGGGAWLIARKVKAARGTAKVSLLPSGTGVILGGSF